MCVSYRGVGSVGRMFDRTSDRVLQPPLQILPDGETFVVEDKPTFPVGESLGKLLGHLLASLAVDGPPLAPLGCVDGVLAHPPAVLAAAYAALTVTALAHLHYSMPTIRPSPTITKQSLIFSCYRINR